MSITQKKSTTCFRLQHNSKLEHAKTYSYLGVTLADNLACFVHMQSKQYTLPSLA